MKWMEMHNMSLRYDTTQLGGVVPWRVAALSHGGWLL
jgi:hypothetical protein